MKKRDVVPIAILIIAVVAIVIVNKVTNKPVIPGENPINPDFYIEAIEKYWENKELFDDVKEYFLTFSENVYIYRRDGALLIKNLSYEDVEIDEDIEMKLISLFDKFSKMNFASYLADEGIVDFELSSPIKEKGVIYIVADSEEEVIEKCNFVKCQYLEENWFYYEDFPGV